MTNTLYNLLLKLEQCDDRHNRCDYLMEHDEITYLLDYITNLQEAIETIKSTNKLLIQQKAQLQDDLDMLDNRINKAIEYIKKNYYEIVYKTKGTMENDLLKILKGE